jgi:hypothetical protein
MDDTTLRSIAHETKCRLSDPNYAQQPQGQAEKLHRRKLHNTVDIRILLC